MGRILERIISISSSWIQLGVNQLEQGWFLLIDLSFVVFNYSVEDQTQAINKVSAGAVMTRKSFDKSGSCQETLKNLGLDQILFVRDRDELEYQTTPLAHARNGYYGECTEFVKIQKTPQFVTFIWNHTHTIGTVEDLALHKHGASLSVNSLIQSGYDDNLGPSNIKRNILKVKSIYVISPCF